LNLLVLADHNGFVDMTPEAIADEILLPLEQVERGIDALMYNDPKSRSPKEYGARIRLIEPLRRLWGWEIVNFQKYRNCRNKDDLRKLNLKRNRKSFVYYIGSNPDGFMQVKIGCSSNPWRRLAELKKSYPKAFLWAIEPGNEELKNQRHQEFKDYAFGQPGWFNGRKIMQHAHDIRFKQGRSRWFKCLQYKAKCLNIRRDDDAAPKRSNIRSASAQLWSVDSTKTPLSSPNSSR
jgi:hypothetical protein